MKEASKPHRPALIRITLKKPMGIDFEPITAGRKAGLDVGAKIKDLPKYGDAAKSGQLDVGDELLSIDDEFTTNMGFDAIMNVLVREKKSLSLLFRRAPEKPEPEPVSSPAEAEVGDSAISPLKKKEKNVDGKAAQIINETVNKEKDRLEKEELISKDDDIASESAQVKDESIKENERSKVTFETDIQEPPPKTVARDTFVGAIIDTLCGPCGEENPKANLDLNQEADGFIYLTDKNTGIVQ